jgi:hypothetical protein
VAIVAPIDVVVARAAEFQSQFSGHPQPKRMRR